MTGGRECVVITGASSGIGAAVAELAARRGFIVFAGVRTEEDAARVAAAHPNLRPLHLDVTENASIASAAREVAAAGLPLRALVNNAGIAIGGPLECLPVAELRRQFDVNVFGALAVTQAFLPLLRATSGRLVFVGSISGRLAVPFIAPYSASKFALRAITDALRVELAPWGIRTALIEPGSVKTPIWQKGRRQRGELESGIGERGVAMYGRALDALFAQIDGEERGGIPVEEVAETVWRALSAARPRARYLIGIPARIGSAIALFPPRLRDRLMRRAMRLP